MQVCKQQTEGVFWISQTKPEKQPAAYKLPMHLLKRNLFIILYTEKWNDHVKLFRLLS